MGVHESSMDWNTPCKRMSGRNSRLSSYSSSGRLGVGRSALAEEAEEKKTEKRRGVNITDKDRGERVQPPPSFSPFPCTLLHSLWSPSSEKPTQPAPCTGSFVETSSDDLLCKYTSGYNAFVVVVFSLGVVLLERSEPSTLCSLIFIFTCPGNVFFLLPKVTSFHSGSRHRWGLQRPLRNWHLDGISQCEATWSSLSVRHGSKQLLMRWCCTTCLNMGVQAA